MVTVTAFLCSSIWMGWHSCLNIPVWVSDRFSVCRADSPKWFTSSLSSSSVFQFSWSYVVCSSESSFVFSVVITAVTVWLSISSMWSGRHSVQYASSVSVSYQFTSRLDVPQS